MTGTSIFEIVLMDVSDPRSVRSAIASIDRSLDALAMNAGGSGGPTPLTLTVDGVTQIFASNILGHVVLLEELISAGGRSKIAELTGSEAALGVSKLRLPRPTFTDSSADEFASVIDGSFCNGRKANSGLAYGHPLQVGTR